MTRTGATGPGGGPGPLSRRAPGAGAGRGPSAPGPPASCRSPGVSAMAEGAGTSRRSARSRTIRYRSGADSSGIGTVGLIAGRARATTTATPAAAGSTSSASTPTIHRAASQPGPTRWPVEAPVSRITAAPAGSRAAASARPRTRRTARARERAACAPASTPIPESRADLAPSPADRVLPWSCSLPTVAPATDIAMPVGQVPERLRGTLVGAPAPVSHSGRLVTRWNGFGQSWVTDSKIRPRIVGPGPGWETGRSGTAGAAGGRRCGRPGVRRPRTPPPSPRCRCGAASRRAGSGPPPGTPARAPRPGPCRWP